jgi:acyl-[acyl-carrier-protein]-phospholipid O-acyltransferase/long-chain-fatty-acid--[acyl-carrier-protein] ligase
MNGFEWWMVPAGVLAYVAVYAVAAWFVPALLRPVWWLIAHVLHRFHVYHPGRVPQAGPVLIVSNHVSYLDWLFFWVACPRPLTFVSWSKYRQNPVLRFLLSFVRRRVIYLDRTTAPHALAAELDQVSAALRDGRCVLVFPEGNLSRNGQMMPFRRGIERVVRRAGRPVTVIPACLWNVWGGLLTYKWGRMYWRCPEVFRRRVAVYFGEPAPDGAKAHEVRAAVVEAMAECAKVQSEYVIPVHAGFVRHAAKWRNFFKVGFVDAATGTDRELTWPKALVGAWGLAGWLKPRLAADEKNVGVWLPTGLGSAFANIALAFLRRTSVNLNYTAGTDSVRAAARQAGLRTVITARRFTDRIPLDLPPDVTVIHLEDALAGISGLAKLWRLALVILLPGWFLDRVVLRCRRFGWDDLLTIVFSSGSTGDPKGVMLSLRNISSNADSFQKGVNFTTADRMLCTLPFFHSFGYTVCLWAPVSIGMASVYYPDPRAAKEVGELSERQRCTIALGTATFVRFYLRRCEPTHFRTVRLFICGAEKLPVALQIEFEAKFGTPLLEGYGCTEVSPVVGANLPDSTVRGVTQVANVRGTIGQPLPGVAVKAFDPESRHPLPVGTEGVLCVSGPNVMVGYLHQPEKTRQAMIDFWYITGDIGQVEPDGFVRITGRLSRFAKIAGEMVPLERLEDEIHDVLGLTGDRAVAVAAVPDSKRGERLVVLHLTEWGAKLKEAFDKLRGKGLPNLWVPDVRDCYPVDTFPALGSGKLDLRGLAELAKKLAPAG